MSLAALAYARRSWRVFGSGFSPSGFSPASLFASGENGAWYEPSPTTCFTDTAGTTAAGVGDAVARINDLSGNGNHATQATAAARPLLQQTAGGLYYLAFDGSDDSLSFSVPTRPDNMHAFLGVNSPVGDTDLCLLGSTDVSYRALFLSGSNNNIHYRGTIDPDYNIYIDGSLFSGPGNDEPGATVAAEFNNTNRVLDIDNLTLTASQFNTLLIGKLATGYFYNGRMYSLILCEAISAGTESNVRSYVATKSGVSL